MQSEENLLVPGIKLATAVTLSFFHPKEGPIVGYQFPRGAIANEILSRISDTIDNTFEEGFYTHSFGHLTSMDYFFEIKSSWARGKKELLMISTIFDGKLEPSVEYSLQYLSIGFANELKSIHEIFKAFYLIDEKTYPDWERSTIRKMDAIILNKVENLLHATNDKISEKIFEKQMTSLALFSDDDASPIRWTIGEEGVKILLSILRGARTRKDIARQIHLLPETLNKHMAIMLSLDLLTEGVEIVLTNRGLKFLGLVGTDFEEQYKTYETESFERIVSLGILQILTAVSEGAKMPQEIATFGGLSLDDVKKQFPILLSNGLLSVEPTLHVTRRGIRFLTYAKQHGIELEKVLLV